MLFALFLLGAARTSTRPRADRRALQRSVDRARDVAKALDIIAVQDSEIPTTFRLDAPSGVSLWMGSPAIFQGTFKRDKIIDWMKLEVPCPPGFPAGVKIRPPIRTVHQWRDGLPGEAPTFVTPGGAGLVIENERGEVLDMAALAQWVDAFPEGARLVMMSPDKLELRADMPAAEGAVACARMLLERARSMPFAQIEPPGHTERTRAVSQRVSPPRAVEGGEEQRGAAAGAARR